jgi:hypothetical protein
MARPGEIVFEDDPVQREEFPLQSKFPKGLTGFQAADFYEPHS